MKVIIIDEDNYVLMFGTEGDGSWYHRYDMTCMKITIDSGLYISYSKRDRYHNITGPARIWKKGHYTFPDGMNEWWIDGQVIPVSSQEEFEKWLKLKAFW